MTNASLPPLNAMKAFEAVSRHLSFTKAAAELGMTQAAVSYQIKLLEERVGSPLFLRRPRQIALSETGKILAPMVTEAFELLRNAFAAGRENAEEILSITVVPTFAAHWLAQRLGGFQLSQPHLAVRMDASTRVFDFSSEEIDLAIRTSMTPTPGLVSHLLLHADFTPMVSPALAATIGGVKTPSDLLLLPLVDPDDRWWDQWFSEAGLAPRPKRAYRGTRLGGQTFEAVATIAGQGVGILTPAFYQDELAEGRLIQPFERTSHDGSGYWLVYPESRRNLPKIRAFRDWILSATEPLRVNGPRSS